MTILDMLVAEVDIPTNVLIGATDLEVFRYLAYEPEDPSDPDEEEDGGIVDGILNGIKDFFGEMFGDIGEFLDTA